jgi:single-strand DNA-binding protein
MSRNTVPVAVVGNLTKEPELKFTPGGVAIARFTVAVNPRQFDKDANEWKDGEPSFYRVVCWRQLAENVTESLPRGARVVVVGALQQRHWEDKGEKKSIWELVAEAVGPDLSYAQAQVRKMARGSRDEVPPDDPWATAGQEPVGAGASGEPPF